MIFHSTSLGLRSTLHTSFIFIFLLFFSRNFRSNNEIFDHLELIFVQLWKRVNFSLVYMEIPGFFISFLRRCYLFSSIKFWRLCWKSGSVHRLSSGSSIPFSSSTCFVSPNIVLFLLLWLSGIKIMHNDTSISIFIF